MMKRVAFNEANPRKGDFQIAPAVWKPPLLVL